MSRLDECFGDLASFQNPFWRKRRLPFLFLTPSLSIDSVLQCWACISTFRQYQMRHHNHRAFPQPQP
jgi:hypothetical protein